MDAEKTQLSAVSQPTPPAPNIDLCQPSIYSNVTTEEPLRLPEVNPMVVDSMPVYSDLGFIDTAVSASTSTMASSEPSPDDLVAPTLGTPVLGPTSPNFQQPENNTISEPMASLTGDPPTINETTIKTTATEIATIPMITAAHLGTQPLAQRTTSTEDSSVPAIQINGTTPVLPSTPSIDTAAEASSIPAISTTLAAPGNLANILVGTPFKRGRGRPRKYPRPDPSKSNDLPKRSRGRPRKYPRPTELDVTSPKRGRGRPRKYPIIEAQPGGQPKRGRGRPRKYPKKIVDPHTPKRGRGRPRKDSYLNATNTAIMASVNSNGINTTIPPSTTTISNLEVNQHVENIHASTLLAGPGHNLMNVPDQSTAVLGTII